MKTKNFDSNIANLLYKIQEYNERIDDLYEENNMLKAHLEASEDMSEDRYYEILYKMNENETRIEDFLFKIDELEEKIDLMKSK